MFKRLRKLLGLKTKAKSDALKSQAPVLPQVQPLPFTLDLAEMQAVALSKLNRQDKKLSVNIGIEISFKTLILTLTSADEAAELVTFTFPALFTDAQKNCLNVGGGILPVLIPLAYFGGSSQSPVRKMTVLSTLISTSTLAV